MAGWAALSSELGEVKWRGRVSFRALDLFCCAGGMSEGLRRAGFEVTAVDVNPQPHHKGAAFLQADAMELLRDRTYLRQFDLIHASPPCQGYSALRHLTKDKEYPKLIESVRFLLQRSGVPWSIENVPGAPLRGNVTVLCGTMFGRPDSRRSRRNPEAPPFRNELAYRATATVSARRRRGKP